MRRRGERGQATVEFALVLPVLLVLVALCVHVGLVVATKLSVTHTAREVARAVAIDPRADADRVASIARPFGSGPMDIGLEWRPVGDRNMVVVTISDHVESPAGFALDADVSVTVAMLSESS